MSYQVRVNSKSPDFYKQINKLKIPKIDYSYNHFTDSLNQSKDIEDNMIYNEHGDKISIFKKRLKRHNNSVTLSQLNYNYNNVALKNEKT